MEIRTVSYFLLGFYTVSLVEQKFSSDLVGSEIALRSTYSTYLVGTAGRVRGWGSVSQRASAGYGPRSPNELIAAAPPLPHLACTRDGRQRIYLIASESGRERQPEGGGEGG